MSLFSASPIVAIETDIGARIGASLGSPVPFGNVPEGATGSPVIGLVVGAYVDWELSPTWSILSEIQFVHYGSSFSTPLDQHPVIDRVHLELPDGSVAVYDVETTFTGTANGRFSNNYLQIPISAAWRAFDHWRFVGGGYLGWLASTSSYAIGTGNVGIHPEIVEKDMYFDEKIKGLDYGLQIGAQFFPWEDLFVDVRGVLGLTSIFTEDFRTVDRTVQNVYVHMSIGYRVF